MLRATWRRGKAAPEALADTAAPTDARHAVTPTRAAPRPAQRRALGWLACAALVAGCGAGETGGDLDTAVTVDSDAADDDALLVDGFHGGEVAAGDGTAADAATGEDAGDASSDATSDGDAVAPSDGGLSFDVDINDPDLGPPPDVDKPETTYAPLQIVATDPPTDGAGASDKAAFSVTFDKPIDPITLTSYTVLVRGPGGVDIAGDLSAKGAQVSFEAAAPLPPLSRVDVTVTPLVSDDLGQTLEAPYTFHFHTPDFADMAPYAQLAARYAPSLDLALAEGADAAFDLLRSPSDIGWDLANAGAQAASTPALARVAAVVVESHSHFFIHYQMFWHRRPAQAGTVGFDNDSAGVTVIVARYPQQRPVGLQTWWKRGDDEQMWLWLTDDAAILPPGAKLSSFGVRAVLPAAKLFPPTTDGLGCVASSSSCQARRAPLLLQGGSHRVCLRLDAGQATGAKACQWDAETAAASRLLRYLPASAPSAASANGVEIGQPPKEFAYALEPLSTTFFARRGSGQLFGGKTDISFLYTPPPGRPAGQKFAMGSKFVGGKGNEFGRPLWAFRWKPASNESYYDLPRGTVTLDPAFALWKRLGGGAGGPGEFDPNSKLGWSLSTCFNPLLFLDARSDAACVGSLSGP